MSDPSRRPVESSLSNVPQHAALTTFLILYAWNPNPLSLPYLPTHIACAGFCPIPSPRTIGEPRRTALLDPPPPTSNTNLSLMLRIT